MIFNDGYYGNVRRDLELDWGGDYETSFVKPDFAKWLKLMEPKVLVLMIH